MLQSFTVATSGERFYDITTKVQDELNHLLSTHGKSASNGMLFILCMHTSCGLLVNEAFDATAKDDLETFYDHIAPRNLSFIRHTAEGPDDSPSHMKTSLTQQNLAFAVQKGSLTLGSWQGIYLTEFRDAPMHRKLIIKFIEG